MRFSLFGIIVFVLAATLLAGSCANIVPPEGGKKDTTPPKLVAVSPADSQLNTRVTEIEMTFDEYVVVSDAAKQVTISPMLPFPLNVEGNKKKVTISIPDSLLQENTTYRLSLGEAVKDLRENNPFSGYTYTFSTGPYFDSLQLNGRVINAATGAPDTGALVVLYSAEESDSVVVRKKPMYVTRVQAGGNFSIKGLPSKPFKIFALRDVNGNMIYDGGSEWIAFKETAVMPTDSAGQDIELYIFPEMGNDTVRISSLDKTASNNNGRSGTKPALGDANTVEFNYRVAVDTNIAARTFGLRDSVAVIFTRPLNSFNGDKVFLSFDSATVEVQADSRVVQDTSTKSLNVFSPWKENTVYTLRLLKGFATDTAGNEALPSKYIFRTKSADDYAKLRINVPSKYYGSKYLLMVVTATDTVYTKPVTDSVVNITLLEPETYSVRVVIDENENGKWDSGDLFAKRQPEIVIPLQSGILLKAGWENTVDIKEKPKFSETGTTDRNSPPQRERGR